MNCRGGLGRPPVVPRAPKWMSVLHLSCVRLGFASPRRNFLVRPCTVHCVTDALSCRPRALFPRLSTDALRRTRCHQCLSLSSFFPQPCLPPGKETPRARAAARSTMPAPIVTACRLLFLVRRRPNLSNATLFLTAPTVAPGTQTWSHSAKERARSLRFVSNRGATSTQYSATDRESP